MGEDMSKLVLEVYKAEVMESNVVRLSDEAVHCIQELQRESGLSACKIASKLIIFASKYAEIKEVE